jgi:hypothetical protein
MDNPYDGINEYDPEERQKHWSIRMVEEYDRQIESIKNKILNGAQIKIKKADKKNHDWIVHVPEGIMDIDSDVEFYLNLDPFPGWELHSINYRSHPGLGIFLWKRIRDG